MVPDSYVLSCFSGPSLFTFSFVHSSLFIKTRRKVLCWYCSTRSNPIVDPARSFQDLARSFSSSLWTGTCSFNYWLNCWCLLSILSEYPNFYSDVYHLICPSICYSNYAQKFFDLVDIILASTYPFHDFAIINYHLS